MFLYKKIQTFLKTTCSYNYFCNLYIDRIGRIEEAREVQMRERGSKVKMHEKCEDTELFRFIIISCKL